MPLRAILQCRLSQRIQCPQCWEKFKEEMEPKAKGEFLKKISINGFSIEEWDNTLTLRPRGAEATAEVIIQEVEPDVWQVVGASGQYARLLSR
ncbi:unnamed protein product [marine sediment metagenome]|uniref:Uncharacterized protein n=1 Tax=marine sediment metagenome TaxID=412755 RepID=X1TZL7_9ZZZZ